MKEKTLNCEKSKIGTRDITRQFLKKKKRNSLN